MEQGSLIADERVAVNPRIIGKQTVGLLRAFPDEPAERARAVRIYPIAEVPEQILLIGEDFASTLDLLPVERTRWRLEFDNFDYLTAQEIILEVTVEQPLEQIVEQLNHTNDLGGRLLWFSGDSMTDDVFLEINGKPYKIREITLSPKGRKTIVEITEQTNLKVFSPGHAAGIDVVILADCSGSMSVPDLTEMADAAPSSYPNRGLTRIDALRQSLKKLLQTRLLTSGRMSRIALVSFTHETEIRFPRGGGMVEFDENTPEKVVREFNDAINLLQAERAATDIGKALYFAAQLIHNHGRPGNDRLVVLISDGADWKPKGQEATGEIVVAIQEPVSLMEHLHREMKIHLHAIGISTREIYMRYHNRYTPGQTPEPSLVPNHELLKRLVEVGGGDPSQTGNTEVLQQYLTGLGAGVTRHLKNPRIPQAPRLSDNELFFLKNLNKPQQRTETPQAVKDELFALKKEIKDLFYNCERHTINTVQRKLFASTSVQIETFDYYLVTEVQNRKDFESFINNFNQSFCEAVDSKIRKQDVDKEPPVIKAVAAELHRKLKLIRDFRVDFLHDKDRNLDENSSGESRRGARADKRQLVEHYQNLIGVKVVEENDCEAWSRLQRAIIRHLRDTLSAVREIYQEAELPQTEAKTQTTEPSQTVGADFILKW